MAKQTIDKFGKIDILVNNAGIWAEPQANWGIIRSKMG